MEKQALACFDFDGTLLPGDSIAAYIRYARKTRVISLKEYLSILGQTALYLLRLRTPEQTKTRALRFCASLSEAQRDAMDERFVREALLPRMYPAGRDCWEEHRAAGRKLLLVSASTENYMRFAAEALNADALLCTPLEKDGSVVRNCRGEEKTRRIKVWLAENSLEADWAASFAYGDSGGDAPMMSLVGHPVLVNPKNKLKKALPQAKRVRWRLHEK